MDLDELVTSEGKGSGSNSPAGVRTSTTFHQKPMGQRQPRQSGQSRRRSSSSSSSKATTLPPLAPKPPASGGHVSLVRSPTIPEENTPTLRAAPPFGAGPPPLAVPQPEYPSAGAGQFPIGNEPGAQSFDILNPDLDLSQFKTPPGSSGGATNYTDLSVSLSSVNANGTQTDARATCSLNAFFPGADGASWASSNPFAFAPPPGVTSPTSDHTQQQAGSTATMNPLSGGGGGAASSSLDPTPAFFGMPLGANLGDEW